MKNMQKYFLAILPPQEFLEKVEELKLHLREKFNVKYALKSPAHVTVKMPFSYDEHKEEKLASMLQDFCSNKSTFGMRVKGVDTFGKRVIFLDIKAEQDLYTFQSDLKKFLKTQVHLPDELSDRNYHPHMTVAFKDLKRQIFEAVFQEVKEAKLESEFQVSELTLLKRLDGKWSPHMNFLLKN
ncbi:2'-5' RNA ligase [Algoriphagus ornithinivorans]|uniref:2'-5' RNA ligase n=2 Tax=Algoriphagus ornithinivorans TaxID=226506 RepID=A0A1I5GD93_9BACT|nr:2'-5' RNA ligase [Algoriphagus ornithinivorans]